MIIVMRPVYTLEVEIKKPHPQHNFSSPPSSGLPPWWDTAAGTGCDSVVNEIHDLIRKSGHFPEFTVRLVRFQEGP
jgi:hypothetical protein